MNWRDVVTDEKARTIYLKRSGTRLDAGGLLKGYAADEVVRILYSRGVRSAIVDLGGDIYAFGTRPDGGPWRIGVQNPDATRGTALGVVRVIGKAVVSSGSYEHFFVQDGKRYHHIMDTRTGFPVDSGLDQVTVISDSSVDADGLGLTLFCLGVRARPCAGCFPRRGGDHGGHRPRGHDDRRRKKNVLVDRRVVHRGGAKVAGCDFNNRQPSDNQAAHAVGIHF